MQANTESIKYTRSSRAEAHKCPWSTTPRCHGQHRICSPRTSWAPNLGTNDLGFQWFGAMYLIHCCVRDYQSYISVALSLPKEYTTTTSTLPTFDSKHSMAEIFEVDFAHIIWIQVLDKFFNLENIIKENIR